MHMFASKKDTTNAGMSKVTLPHQDLAHHHFKKMKINQARAILARKDIYRNITQAWMITKTQMSGTKTYPDNWDNCVNLKGSYGNIISEMKKKILPKEKFSAIQSIKLLYYIVVHDKLLTLLIFDIPGLTQDLCLCGTLLACQRCKLKVKVDSKAQGLLFD